MSRGTRRLGRLGLLGMLGRLGPLGWVGVACVSVLAACGKSEPPPIVLRLWSGQPAADAARRAADAGDATAPALTAPWVPTAQGEGSSRGAPVAESAVYVTHFDGKETRRPAPAMHAAPAAPAKSAAPAVPDSSGAQQAPVVPEAPSGWFRVVQDSEAGDLHLAPFEAPSNGKLVLQRAEAAAALIQLPVVPGEALSVTVSVRTPGAMADDPVSVAALVELREPLSPDARFTPEDVGNLLDIRRHATHLLEQPLGPRPVELRTEFVVDSDSRFLAVYLLAPFTDVPQAVFIESLVVRSRPVTAHVAAGGEFPRLQRLATPGTVRVSLDRDEREGLLALPGAHWAFELLPCATARRLDLSLGMAERVGGAAPGDAGKSGDVGTPGASPAPGAAASTLDVRITARGEDAQGEPFEVSLARTLSGTTSLAQAAWNDVTLDLPASPDEPLRLSFTATGHGDEPPLAVFGHPTVRAPRTPGPREPSGPSAQRTPPVRPRPNIVLISLDTLRPDRLGCYGGEAGLTPHLDGLAAAGLRFTQAESTSSYTLPSHASLLTGQYPAFHGAVDTTDRLDPARSPFLAHLLADAGWVTAAFTGGGYVSTEYGFGVGFDRYSINDPVWAVDGVRGRQLLETRAWERTPAQLPLLRRYAAPMIGRWIEQQQDGVPFFLFLHTYIVHNYAPDHDWLVKRGLLQADGTEAPFDHKNRSAYNDAALLAEGEPGAEVATDALRDRIVGEYMPYYDATVGMADEFVGGVLAALDRAGFASNTLVVVTADHGEEFGEHRFFGHGETLFESNTRVPLIVRLPAGTPESVGGPAPSVQDAPVSLVDVAPWILRIAGLEPDGRMAVRAPLGPERVAPPARSQLFIELDTSRWRLSVARRGALKLHMPLSDTARGMTPGDDLLFDLATDPDEQTDLSAARVPERQDLAGLVRRLHDAAESLHPRGAKVPLDLDSLDPETIEMLIQLGYLGADGKLLVPQR